MLPDRGLNSRLVRRRASCHVTEHTGLLSTEHADLMYFRPRAAHSDAQVGCAGTRPRSSGVWFNMAPKSDWVMVQQPSADAEGWDATVLNSQQACRALVEGWQRSRSIRANIKPGSSAPGCSQVLYSYCTAETKCTFSWRHEFSSEGHAVHTRGKHGDKEKAKYGQTCQQAARAKASADVPPLRAMTNLIRDGVPKEEWPTMGALRSARKQHLQADKGTGSSADYRLGQWKTFIRSAAFVPFDLNSSEAAAWKWSAWEADSDRGHCVFSCPALLRRAAEFAVLAAEGEGEGVYATKDSTFLVHSLCSLVRSLESVTPFTLLP